MSERWTPESLACAVARRWVNQDESESQADAVEQRLVRAARAAAQQMWELEAYHLGELISAVEAAEKWGER